jgi:hypothetical protein
MNPIKVRRLGILAKAQAVRLCARLGLQVRRLEDTVVDLRGRTSDPIEASYLSGSGSPLIDVPLADCRILWSNAFPCTPEAGNPFVDTLIAYEQGRCTGYEDSPLRRFYAAWTPRSAAEVMGRHDHPVFSARGPYAFLLPWWDQTPESAEAALLTSIWWDTRRAAPPAAAGWKCWGPISREAGALEFERLVRVCASIRATGYLRSARPDDDVAATVLHAAGQSRYLISPGHHRAAAMAALGARTIPVRLAGIVRREEAPLWPAVRAGWLGLEEAQAIFDRILDGRQPQGCPARPGLRSGPTGRGSAPPRRPAAAGPEAGPSSNLC